MSYKDYQLDELFKMSRKNVKPNDTPEEKFLHYSIPAYDNGEKPLLERGALIKSNKYLLKEPSILVSKLNPRINRVWKFDNDDKNKINSICSTEFMVYERKSSDIELEYYYQFFKSKIFQRYLLNLQSGSTGSRMRVSPSDTLSIPIPKPNKKQQQKIAAILSSVDEAIEKTEQIIEQTETVKKGLMQQLLTKGIGHTEYKDSSIGMLPSNWCVKNLSELSIKILGGGTPSRKVPEYYDGIIPWVTVKDLEDKQEIDDSQEHISELGLQKSAANLIPKNNLIVSTRMAVGKAFINTADVAINQDMKGIIVNNDIIETDYLFYVYTNNKEKIEHMGTGTTVKGIRLEQLKKLEFGIPPKDEQMEIVSILSTLNEKQKNNKITKNNLERLRQGLMQQLLTGKVRVQINENEEVPS